MGGKKATPKAKAAAKTKANKSTVVPQPKRVVKVKAPAVSSAVDVYGQSCIEYI